MNLPINETTAERIVAGNYEKHCHSCSKNRGHQDATHVKFVRISEKTWSMALSYCEKHAYENKWEGYGYVFIRMDELPVEYAVNLIAASAVVNEL